MSENDRHSDLDDELRGLADNLTDLAEQIMDMEDVRIIIGDKVDSARECIRIVNKWIETILTTMKSPIAKRIAGVMIRKFLSKEKKDVGK